MRSALLPVFFFCAFSLTALDFPESVFSDMVSVPGGSFMMGSKEGAFGQNEKVHEVTVSSFYIMDSEVTQELYSEITGTNPSRWKGASLPVEGVSWFDAVAFCNELSEKCGLAPAYLIEGENVIWNRDSKGFRLPTEAEWEYAARGGSRGNTGTLEKTGYSGGVSAADCAWYRANSGRRTQPVKGKNPNELGLYDMSGNVWEWCWDYYGDYPSEAVKDPAGVSSSRNRVFRGGSWMNQANQLRVTFRIGNPPATTANSVGFRVARSR